MSCEVLADKVTGYLDHALDQRSAEEVEAHLRQCITCSARLERDRRLRLAIQGHLPPFRAPDRLRDGVRAAVRAQAKRARPRRAWVPTWAATAAALIIGLAAGWRLASWQDPRGEVADLPAEVVASHVRSLEGDHLTDIGSSEHHTLKPWFAGKLDFSPPVPDLTAEGFILVGGRLDYLGEQEVAALVYRGRQHLINLFVWPVNDATAAPRVTTRRGYNLVTGTSASMTYWAVSDLSRAELAQFARLIADDLSQGPTSP